MLGLKFDRKVLGMRSRSIDIRIMDNESRPPGMKVFSNSSWKKKVEKNIH